MIYRKRSPIVQAEQWWKHGDSKRVSKVPLSNKTYRSKRDTLGWLDTQQGGHVVFPGDFIIVEKATGAVTSCNPMSFERLYEPIDMRILPVPRQHKVSA